MKNQKIEIENLWNRFKNWITSNAPHLSKELQPSVQPEEIKQLQQTIQTELPEDFIAFLSIHNGQNRNADGFIDAEELLSSDRIMDEWKIWYDLYQSGDFDDSEAEPDEEIKNFWWNPKWIPITYDGSGNHLCIDMDPTENGTKGQIIRMWHDDSVREFIAPSFKVFFENYCINLENDIYAYSDEWGGIINKEDI
ncbi:SMI1/KNR4 family protein [Tenacibaculum larymnensis]|uniref:SMI1/KNR4 family protein n=1 Tax=Tenacibaculum larymnensis TaxID=2878201 RepID=A0A9X4ILW6_9FLAO|nr:SMI1/KNR4 family protein [Tenacibaculum larymnensis]MDE1207008.1 SMI1/KNR4 family protein [Tenacibaculum larymnensis]